jgi:GMP synthase (glutamine-hydrolysing)
MSHGDRIERSPDGFITLAASSNSPFAAIGDLNRRYFGVQFHPEVRHTQGGTDILRRFAVEVCEARLEWTPESIISQTIRIQGLVAERAIGCQVGVDLA